MSLFSVSPLHLPNFHHSPKLDAPNTRPTNVQAGRRCKTNVPMPPLANSDRSCRRSRSITVYQYIYKYISESEPDILGSQPGGVTVMSDQVFIRLMKLSDVLRVDLRSIICTLDIILLNKHMLVYARSTLDRHTADIRMSCYI